MTRILVVDDDAELRESVAEILSVEGFEVHTAPDSESALRQIDGSDFDLILIDLIMPGMGGMTALPTLKKRSPRTTIVMMTAFSTVSNAVQAMKQGADDYVTKPFKIDELFAIVRQNLEEARFLACQDLLDMDETFSSLANTMRRRIIVLLHREDRLRFMEITRYLEVEDHTKVNFHLKVLKEAGLVEQDDDRSYRLSKNGIRIAECLDYVGKSLNT
jgi:DNA-binding response OmpR family regulator